MRKLLTFLPLTLLIVVGSASADLTITVEDSADWGQARTSNIQRLCENVASHFQQHLREEHKVEGEITVVYHANHPIIWALGNNQFKIGLHVGRRDWAQFSFQFGHEFGHVMQHEDGRRNDNNGWFYEGLCELASLWVIKQMVITWEHRPPYTNWKDYRHALADYVNWMTTRSEVQYNGIGAEWLDQWEDGMRDGSDFTYARIAQLTYKFLPIFENNPKAWNIVRQMPPSNAKMSKYMQDWYDRVDLEDKQYVESIAKIMDITITPVIESETETFAEYTNLTFTYENDNAIIPTNAADEWDGWSQGIWEKHPDGTINQKPLEYKVFTEIESLSDWMYSHAPSKISYDISQRNHISFSAYFMLPNSSCGGSASMEFTAFADDTEIYTKALYLLNYGTHIEFDIPADTSTFRISIDDLGNNHCDHFVLGEPRLYYDNAQSIQLSIDADINKDGYIDLYDVLIVRSGITHKTSYNTDVNNDGKTDIVDLLIVKAKAMETIAAASPSKRKVNITSWGAVKVK